MGRNNHYAVCRHIHVFPKHDSDSGFSQCIGAVTYNGYVGNRISWVDGICKIDLCKCFVHTRERLCRIGKGDWYENIPILLRYVLPNSLAPVIISFTFRTAQAIITESSLSFLGLGVQPPEASWGNILYYAQSISVLSSKLYMWVPAGILLVLTVLSINFIGDGIRDALDTKMKV